MYYECDLNGTPVSCQLIQWDAVSGKCLIEYTDPIGLLRLWVDVGGGGGGGGSQPKTL
jgi:hypothetical protein